MTGHKENQPETGTAVTVPLNCCETVDINCNALEKITKTYIL